MAARFSPQLRRVVGLAVTALALVALWGCGEVAASLPVRPTAVPTLARLPSVTPVTPRPTAPPTMTPQIVVTPTVASLTALVARNANVRSGPGVGFGIIAVQDGGARVTLEGRSGQWYRVRTAEGDQGWMSGQVLEIDEAINAAVPEVTP